MNRPKQMVVPILFLVIAIFGCILFWPLLASEVITPLALAAWVLLRIFVLSIDQQCFWAALIFTVLMVLARLLPWDAEPTPSDDFPDENGAIETIGYWRSIFVLTDLNARDERVVRRELARLVVALHASKQRVQPDFRFYDALQRGETPLPDHIRSFLFPAEAAKAGRSPKEMLEHARAAFRNWIRRRTGQETAEYYRMVDETLRFVEASLEMKNDDAKFTPNEN